MNKLIIAFITVALACASAATKYNVSLFQRSVVNGTEIKPGDYKVEVEGDKAIFKQGKTTVEVPVKVEDTEKKNPSNTVRYAEGGKLQEIRIGGTKTRLLFNNTPAAAADDVR